MDSDSLVKLSDRGDEAQRLWDNPLLRTALQAMEDAAVMELKAVKPSDIEGRDAAWRELRSIERFTRKLEGYIITGKQAKKGLYARLKEHL